MKKYTIILFVFLFVFYLFAFNASFVQAYDPGCTSMGPFSITTGQPCYDSPINSANVFLNQQFQIGARSPNVVALQQMLASAGFPVGRIDGVYGPKTDRAFVLYQAQYNYPIYSPAPIVSPILTTAPVISGVNGPLSLNVNQQGTWTVTASNPYYQFGATLLYSVDWGDQPVYVSYLNNNIPVYSSQQNATFTHSYLQAGTYTLRFTVTNQNGQIAQTSLSVNVFGVTNYIAPVIYSLTPTSGRIGTQVTINGAGFGTNNINTNSCILYGGSTCANPYLPNIINFSGNIIPNVYSFNGTSLTFNVPSYSSPACLYSNPACMIAQTQILPGIYPVSVVNANGVSNSMNFVVNY